MFKAILCLLIFGGSIASADLDCNQELDRIGKPYYEICRDETILKDNPQFIYHCVVEYNLDKAKWFPIAKQRKVSPNWLCLNDRPVGRAAQIRPELVVELLSLGADPNLMDGHCRTSIGWAAYKGNVEIFKLMEAAGGDMNIRDGSRVNGECVRAEKWNAPIHWAVDRGSVKMTEYLIGKNVNVNAYGFYGTPLMKAAKGVGCPVCGDFVQTVELLLMAGAEVDAQSLPMPKDQIGEGQTALFYAAFQGHVDSVKLLVEAGANVNHKNKHGYSVMDGAAHSYFFRKEKIAYLCSKGAKSPLCER